MPWVVLALILLTAALLRVRMIDIPLERDEGEYAYAGQLLLRGVPPYTLAYTVKPPGTPIAYAISMAVFGESVRGVRIGFFLVNLASVVFVFLLGRRLFDAWADVAAAAAFAVLSLSAPVLGQAGHATQFVVLPALAGLLVFQSGLGRRHAGQVFAGGVLLGVAILMKQAGALFGLFAAAALVVSLRAWRRSEWKSAARLIVALALGGVLPLALVVIWMWLAGSLESFWFWTFHYARTYGGILPLSDGWIAFTRAFSRILANAWPLWALAGLGFALLWLERRQWGRAVYMAGLLLFSTIAVSLGLYFREHYFVLVLPVVALLIGIGVRATAEWLTRAGGLQPWVVVGLPSVVAVMAILHSVWNNAHITFSESPARAARLLYGPNPFPESEQVAAYIKANSSPDDRIAVIGSEPQIYFLSQRLSATGFIYTYPLMEPHAYAAIMHEQMIAEIAAAKPKFIVIVNVPWSWLGRKDSLQTVLDWAYGYCNENYEWVGVVDIVSSNETAYRWGQDVAGYNPRGPHLLVAERRPLLER